MSLMRARVCLNMIWFDLTIILRNPVDNYKQDNTQLHMIQPFIQQTKRLILTIKIGQNILNSHHMRKYSLRKQINEVNARQVSPLGPFQFNITTIKYTSKSKLKIVKIKEI